MVLPNGKSLVRKCLPCKYAQVFFTAVNTVIHGFLLPAHSWLYLTYVIVLGYIVSGGGFIVVQTCVAGRPALYTARAPRKSASCSCRRKQGSCVWALPLADVCFKFLRWLQPAQQLIPGVPSAAWQLCTGNCSGDPRSLPGAERDLHLLMSRPRM